MKSQKQHHYDKLQKSSTLFIQLGLVLALLIVYLVIETNFEKTIIVPNNLDTDEPMAVLTSGTIIEIERPKKSIEEKIKKTQIITNIIKKTPDDTSILNPDIFKSEDMPSVTIDSIFTVEATTPDDPPVDFIALEQAPVFPGCEGLNEKESKLCFTKKIQQFVNRKFNTNLASELNLTGRQRIFAQFTIDKNGKIVDIKTKALHVRLEKEAQRVINELPQMTPGKQRLRPVKVKYTLPIVFEVH